MKDWKLRQRPRGFVVVDGAGASVSPGFRTPEAAIDWFNQRAAAAKPPKRRPCLCCGHSFQSEGIHDRLCNECGAGRGRPSRAASA